MDKVSGSGRQDLDVGFLDGVRFKIGEHSSACSIGADDTGEKAGGQVLEVLFVRVEFRDRLKVFEAGCAESEIGIVGCIAII